MSSLLDIAPPEITTERFEFRGGYMEVRGLRNREWAMLLRRFPELRRQFAGIVVPQEEMAVTSIEIMLPVIAAGLGNIGDEKIEALLYERLSDAEIAKVFDVVMRLTMPPVPLAESPAGVGQDGGQATTTTPTASSN